MTFRIAIALLIAASFASPAFTQDVELHDVFIGGEDGYHTYRIPALLIAEDGSLLAFCEGRKQNAGDTGDIDLVMKRSEDDGASWSALQVIHEEGGDAPITIGNPCPILEPHSGVVHLLFTRNNKRLFSTASSDNGLTWSTPIERTEILDSLDCDWIRVASGPVHGIQTRTGRLIAPLWLSDAEREDRNKDDAIDRYRCGILYSDDGGDTWQTGGLVPATLNRLNECTVAEIKDRLLLNIRCTDAGARAVSYSQDGGATWSEPVLDESLPCPTCQASLLRSTLGNESRHYFSNPASATSRESMTLRISEDDCETWPTSIVLYEGPSGYSDLAELHDSRIACLFECGETQYSEKISIAIIE